MFQKLSFEGIGEYMVPRSPLEFSNYDNLLPKNPKAWSAYREF